MKKKVLHELETKTCFEHYHLTYWFLNIALK